MANAISTVEDLAGEVADLLRHDNLDTRLYQWLGMAFNDIVQRSPLELFCTYSQDIVATGEYSTAIGEHIGTPVAAIFVNADIVYMARYVTPADYNRITSTGAEIAAATIPLFWTVKNDGSTYKLFITPPASGATTVTLVWAGNYLDTPPTNTSILGFPYHFEHVLIWGAAAIGASILRTPAFPIYEAEYGQAFDEMLSLIGYRPDAVPVLRSIKGPYAGTPKLNAPPRFPQTIS